MKNKLVFALVLFSTNSFAVITTSTECESIQWNQNKTYIIKSSLEKGTMIHFPTSLSGAILLNQKLWEAKKDLNHLLVKPSNPSAGTTTVTAIDENNKAYTFTFIKTRSKKADAPCVFIHDNQTMFNVGNSLSGNKSMTISTQNIHGYKKQNIKMQQKINEMESIRESDIDRAVKAELSKVRAKSYSWSDEKIAEVYDNGRFTSIRTHIGDLQVRSIIGFNYTSDGFLGMFKGEEQEILDFDFLSPVNTYEVSGIYDGFIIKYGSSELRIEREK